MTCRDFRFYRLAIVALLVTASACSPSPPPTGIVLVTIDTLRADHLPSYGYPRPVAPFLTELAEEGVTFERAISSCPHTAPSHASIFTGLHPPQHRLLENGQPLDPALVTLPAIASEQGYATAAVTPAGFLATLGERFDRAIVAPSYRPAAWVVDQGLAWLQGLAADRSEDPRFLLWLHFFDVHEWHVPARLDGDARESLPGLTGPRDNELAAWLAANRGDALEQLGTEQALLDIADAYDGQILAVDRELRRLAEGLHDLGLDGSTLWVVTADHGEGLGNHGYQGHGKHLYNEQLHVPLVIHAGDRRWRPRTVTDVVQLVDLTPTLAWVIGGSVEGLAPEPAGRSLLPLLEGDERSWQARRTFSVRRPVDELRRSRGWLPGEVMALQGPRFKVIVRSEGPDELYDLLNDPYEVRDLSSQRPDELARLERSATRALALYREQGEAISTHEIDPRHVKELKALGYL